MIKIVFDAQSTLLECAGSSADIARLLDVPVDVLTYDRPAPA